MTLSAAIVATALSLGAVPLGGAPQDAPSQGVTQAQERSFDRVLAIVQAIPDSMRPVGYAAPDAATVAALREQARSAQDPGEFRAAVTQLLASTGLSHHAIIPHDAVPDGDVGEGRHGMTLAVIDGHAVVTRVEPRMLDITFDEPAVPTIRFGMLPPIPAECGHRIIEPLEWKALGLDAAAAPKVGMIRLGVWMPTLAPCIDGAVDALRECDAIVMDLRGNPGGLGLMATGVAGHFLSYPVSLGRMVTPEVTLEFPANPRLVDTKGDPVRPFAGPLAILVDGGTASTSEIFAAGLEDVGRAEIFGGPSAGAALPAITTRLDNGDVLLYAIGDFRSARGRAIEGTGVVQGTGAPPALADYIACPDPVLRDALRWIESRRAAAAPAPPSAAVSAP